ncbi:hypothetical protein HY745_13375 [Candidatus Desantisbacteria bacterium]|nr:hypothetical protein [Candidatus Desantisbacteria bacterium]
MEKDKEIEIRNNMDFTLLLNDSEQIGAYKATNMMIDFASVARFKFLTEIKKSDIFKRSGKTWDVFCKETLKRSRAIIDAEIKLFKELGEPFLKTAEQIGLKKCDLLYLDRSLPEDAKVQLKRGVLEFGGKEFKVSEIAEDSEDFFITLGQFKKDFELTKKEVKSTEKEIKGIKEEHKKEIEAYQHKVKQLEVQIINPNISKEYEESFKLMEEKAREIVLIANRMNFKNCHKEFTEGTGEQGQVKAKYLARLRVMENQFNGSIEAINIAICE